MKERSKIKVPGQMMFPIQINIHNLAMSPDDLPDDNEYVFNEKGEMVYHSAGEWYIVSDYYEEEQCLYSTPKLWYDIPQFDTDTTELEKLSKEELIKLIIKERGKK